MVDPNVGSWAGNIVTSGFLDSTTIGSGTSLPSTWDPQRLFFHTTEGNLYINTGTEGTPSWSTIGGTEFKSLTTAETFNPKKQTGLTHLVFEKEGITSGNVKWYIDGTLQDTFDSSSTGQYNKLIKPSTSLQFVSAEGVWTDTQYNGVMVTPSYGIADHHGFDISPDGVYWARVGDRTLICRQMTTPYDIGGGASSLGSWVNGLGSRYGYSIKYGNSGNNLFVGINPSNIYKYNLPNAYYWTGTSGIPGGLQQTYDPTNSGALGNGQVWGIEFNSDGTKMFTNTNSNSNNIYEHTLTTGWDLTTASYSGNSYNTTMSSTDMRGFAISSDGVWIYTTTGAAGSSLLYRHEMSTPWDITTATIDSTSIDISTLTGESSKKLNAQMAVSNSDRYLYVAMEGGAQDRQYRLELQTIFSGEFNIAIS